MYVTLKSEKMEVGQNGRAGENRDYHESAGADVQVHAVYGDAGDIYQRVECVLLAEDYCQGGEEAGADRGPGLS